MNNYGLPQINPQEEMRKLQNEYQQKMNNIYSQAQQAYNQSFQPQAQQQYQQPVSQQPQQNFIKCMLVTTVNEAQGHISDTPYVESTYKNANNSEFYTKGIGANGLPYFRVYRLMDAQMVQEQAPPNSEAQFVTLNEYKNLIQYVNQLEEQINSLKGIFNNESGVSIETNSVEPTNSSNVSATKSVKKPAAGLNADDK